MAKKRKVNAKFIEKELIPFILRERGRGFDMENWYESGISHEEGVYYNCQLEQAISIPACGTVCCIGGSVQHLKDTSSKHRIATILGLTYNEAYGLFYNFHDFDETEGTNPDFPRWPTKFINKLKDADTPLAQAKVAVALLKEVVKTNGECLHPKPVK